MKPSITKARRRTRLGTLKCSANVSLALLLKLHFPMLKLTRAWKFLLVRPFRRSSAQFLEFHWSSLAQKNGIVQKMRNMRSCLTPDHVRLTKHCTNFKPPLCRHHHLSAGPLLSLLETCYYNVRGLIGQLHASSKQSKRGVAFVISARRGAG